MDDPGTRVPRFTVVTPVYNRRHVLHRPYESLQAQTCRDFEWIVVDDGSTDDVLSLLSEYQKAATFPMRVLSQSNQGKHAAWNYAVREARGELCVQLDSDDICVPETLGTFLRLWEEIPLPQRHSFSGINVLCFDPLTQEVIGDRFAANPLDTNNLEIAFKYHLQGEHWGCIRIDVLREFPFPETSMSTCVPESVVWFRIARSYQVRCVNVALRGYFKDQEVALTSRQLTGRNLYGDWYSNTSLLAEHFGFVAKRPSQLLRTAANTWRFARHASIPVGEWRKALGSGSLLAFLLLPLGELLYRRDLKYRERKPKASALSASQRIHETKDPV